VPNWRSNARREAGSDGISSAMTRLSTAAISGVNVDAAGSVRRHPPLRGDRG
jgi:hypothetical protein